jgi:hypothetical protein
MSDFMYNTPPSPQEHKDNNVRCFICNRVLSEPRFNADHQDFDPCEACMEVVNDTLAGYTDRPSLPEDEYADEATLYAESLDSLSEDVYGDLEDYYD